jgi:prefoldin subunit 5
MRFQAQQREQEKRPYTCSQELEESKAKLKGLTTALEFIQAEQEILVERVLPIDEQQHTLESLSKASRTMDQRMVRET